MWEEVGYRDQLIICYNDAYLKTLYRITMSFVCRRMWLGHTHTACVRRLVAKRRNRACVQVPAGCCGGVAVTTQQQQHQLYL